MTGPARLLVTTPQCESCYVQSALVNGIDAVSRPFDFSAGGGLHADVEIVVSRGGGVIEGRVRGDRTEPVTAFSVVAFSTDRSAWHPRSRVVKSAVVTNGTSLRITALPPGEYFVAAVDNLRAEGDSSALDNPMVLERLSTRAQRVTVSEREHQLVTLRPIPR